MKERKKEREREREREREIERERGRDDEEEIGKNSQAAETTGDIHTYKHKDLPRQNKYRRMSVKQGQRKVNDTNW